MSCHHTVATEPLLRDHHHVEDVMGTMVSIDVRAGEDPATATQAVVAWLHFVDDTFSPYKETSTISALGRGELDIDRAEPEVRQVLRLCEQVRADSGGAFDVFEVPAPNGTRFDPSGLVKGWSIEVAAHLLESHGCQNFCINAGGDVAIRGGAHPGQTWRVGITNPANHDSLLCVVEANGPLGIATSGTYERGAHIIDPRTNLPTTAVASATVIGPDLAIADGYATAAFVLANGAIDWIASRPGYEALIVAHDGQTSRSPGFDRYLAADRATAPAKRPPRMTFSPPKQRTT